MKIGAGASWFAHAYHFSDTASVLSWLKTPFLDGKRVHAIWLLIEQ
jgi:hypothetical protein